MSASEGKLNLEVQKIDNEIEHICKIQHELANNKSRRDALLATIGNYYKNTSVDKECKLDVDSVRIDPREEELRQLIADLTRNREALVQSVLNIQSMIRFGPTAGTGKKLTQLVGANINNKPEWPILNTLNASMSYPVMNSKRLKRYMNEFNQTISGMSMELIQNDKLKKFWVLFTIGNVFCCHTLLSFNYSSIDAVLAKHVVLDFDQVCFLSIKEFELTQKAVREHAMDATSGSNDSKDLTHGMQTNHLILKKLQLHAKAYLRHLLNQVVFHANRLCCCQPSPPQPANQANQQKTRPLVQFDVTKQCEGWTIDWLPYNPQQRGHPVALAIHSFAMWLYSYRNLYESSCLGCGNMLAFDSDEYGLLVPSLRIVHNQRVACPFHVACLPSGN